MILIDCDLIASDENKKANQRFIFIRKFKRFERFEKTMKVKKLKCCKRLSVDLNNN